MVVKIAQGRKKYTQAAVEIDVLQLRDVGSAMLMVAAKSTSSKHPVARVSGLAQMQKRKYILIS